MKTLVPVLLALLPIAAAAATPETCKVAVAADPVVIRLDKDEFRIAFSVAGEECRRSGCTGAIRYKAAWRTDDGVERTDQKLVSFDIPNGASRSIAVDRNYFDTGEGKHTTDVVEVRVDDVSCQRARLSAER
jgi:hypothetical protein